MYKQLILTSLVKEAGRKNKQTIFPKNSPISIRKYMFEVNPGNNKSMRNMEMDMQSIQMSNRPIYEKGNNAFSPKPYKLPTCTFYTPEATNSVLSSLQEVGNINRALKGKLPNKLRKQLTKPLMQQQVFNPVAQTRASLKPGDYREKGALNVYDSLFKPIGKAEAHRLNTILNKHIKGAKSDEILRYIIDNNTKGKQREIMRHIQSGNLFDVPNNAGYYAGDHKIEVSKELMGDFFTHGHEYGHSLSDTSTKPRGLFLPEVLQNDPLIFSTSVKTGPFSKFRDHNQAIEVQKFFNEVEANRQFRKVMRKALAGNKPLYDRFRKLQYSNAMPCLAGYFKANESTLRDAIQYLPKSLQRKANIYLGRYEKYVSDAYSNYRKAHKIKKSNPTRLPTASDIMNHWEESYDRAHTLHRYAASKLDPNFTNDLYEYLQTQGMKPNMDMWWRHTSNIKPTDNSIQAYFKSNPRSPLNRRYVSYLRYTHPELYTAIRKYAPPQQ